MNAEIEIDYELSRIAYETAEAGHKPVKLYFSPLCLLTGEMSDGIRKCFSLEMNFRLSTMEIAGIVDVLFEYVEKQVEEAINDYRGRMESQGLSIVGKFYVPILFMLSENNCKVLETAVEGVKKKLAQMGFRNKFRIVLYCFIDFEAETKDEIIGWLNEFTEEEGLSVYFFTKNILSYSEYNKYVRAVQAAVLHIFLSVTEGDKILFNVKNSISKKILGYWSLDLMKLLFVEQMVGYLDRQNKFSFPKFESYRDIIKKQLDDLAKLKKENLLEKFYRSPIAYGNIKSRLSTGIFSGNRDKNVEYGQLLELLYGRTDVFTVYLKDNSGLGELEERAEQFLENVPGSLYDMQERLQQALKEIAEQYKKRYLEYEDAKRSYQEVMRIPRKNGIDEIQRRLFGVFFEPELQMFILDKKLQLISLVSDRLRSDTFKERLADLQTGNQEQKNVLISLRSSLIAGERSIGVAVPGEGWSDLEYEAPAAVWNKSAFSKEITDKIREIVLKARGDLEVWSGKNLENIYGDFIAKAGEKRREGADKFYAAYIEFPKDTGEYQEVLLNSVYQDNRQRLKAMKDKTDMEMPDTDILFREWESRLTVEMLAVKELDDIRRIYGLSGGCHADGRYGD